PAVLHPGRFRLIRREPRYMLFPYTTLFRSTRDRAGRDRLGPWPRAGAVGFGQPAQGRRGRGQARTDCALLRRRSAGKPDRDAAQDRKSTRLNSSHVKMSYAVFCLKKNKTIL